jgi:hypothetical protein
MSAESNVSRWSRLKEYLHAECKVCPKCCEYRLWSRNACQICGTLLIKPQEDPTLVFIQSLEAKFGQKFWSWEEWKKKHPGEKD